MKISQIVSFLEEIANPSLQENYDNAGLITGNNEWECTGIICALDATEEVIDEAIMKNCNMVIAHHPIVFRGLKKINGSNYVERTIIKAIKNDVAIYAIHTNLDNVLSGVSGRMAEKLGLRNVSILQQKGSSLFKLFTFVPIDHAEKLREALFKAGAGHIGKYSDCSFNTPGEGTYRPGEGTNPFIGKKGEQSQEKETRIEVVFPAFLEKTLLRVLKESHPYEEVAYDVIALQNTHPAIGSGVIGDLPEEMSEPEFLNHLQKVFDLKLIRHTPFHKTRVRRVALCGGAGSFLIFNALKSGADVFVTGDMKYHEFFDADNRMVIADIGHYESEQFTIGLLQEILEEKFRTFAVLKTSVNTNPVRYFS